MKPSIGYFAVTFLVLALPILSGQERTFSVVLLPPVSLAGAEEAEVFTEPLHSAIELQLKENRFEVLDRELVRKSDHFLPIAQERFLPAERVIPIGRSLNANLVVTVSFGIEVNRIFIHVKGFDVRTSRLAAAVSETGFAGLAGFRLIEQAAARFATDLITYRETFDPNEPITLEAIASLVFLSENEGMRVSLDSREKVGTITNGELKVPYVPFRVDAQILVRKEKEGHHPETEKVFLNPGENRISLNPLQRKYRNEFGFGWTLGEAAGLGVEYRRYLEPDYFFVSFAGRFYLQGDTLLGSSPVFHTDTSVSFGGYLFTSHNALLRFGYNLGVGVIVTSFNRPGMPVYTDYYLNMGSPFIELNFSPWAVFLMARLQFGLGMGNDLLGTGLFEIQQGGIPITLGVRRKW